MLRLVLVLVAAAVFVLATGSGLPATVASHFVVGGAANGYMPRHAYLGLMLAVAVGIPLLLQLPASLIRRLPARWLNLPNREYWLAPERREATLAFLEQHSAVFPVVVAVFVCVVHWLVVQANVHTPPRLAEAPLFVALGVLFAAVIAWIAALVLRFRKVPGQ
jgi:hypothetical protein